MRFDNPVAKICHSGMCFFQWEMADGSVFDTDLDDENDWDIGLTCDEVPADGIKTVIMYYYEMPVENHRMLTKMIFEDKNNNIVFESQDCAFSKSVNLQTTKVVSFDIPEGSRILGYEA